MTDVDRLLARLADGVETVDLRFIWRPQLSDPDDELVLDAAVNGRADAIVTFNVADFEQAAPHFGLKIMTENGPGKAGGMKHEAHPLRLPAGIRNAAERLAEEDGVTLNDWIASAVAQKIGAVETAEYFRKRAGVERVEDLHEILARVPTRQPDPGDELPPGWESSQRA